MDFHENSYLKIIRESAEKNLYLCPEVLSLVGDPLTGRRVWFTDSHLVCFSYFPFCDFFFTYVLFSHFILDIK